MSYGYNKYKNNDRDRDKGERIYTPIYDYDNILWKNVDRAIEEPTNQNAERLLKTIRIMLHQKKYTEDLRTWRRVEKEIKEESERLIQEYEEELDNKLKHYELDDGEAWSEKMRNRRMLGYEIETMRAEKIIDFVLSSAIVQDSFKRRENILGYGTRE